MTTFDEAHYRWQEDPNDGEYELQFDRFESNKAVLLIVDREIDEIVGQVVLPANDVPGLDPDDPITTRIFYGIIEDSEIVDITYDPELSEQRHKKAQQQLDDLFRDDESETDN